MAGMNPGPPKELDAFQQVGDFLAPSLLTAPMIGGIGGAAAKAVPAAPKIAGALGRIGASGILGGAEAASKGEDPLTRGLQNVGTAALWEGLMPLAKALPRPKYSLGAMEKRVGAFDYATRAPQEAFEVISKQHPTFADPNAKWMFVPSIDSNNFLSLKDATTKISKLQGVDFNAAWKEIGQELKRFDDTIATSAARGLGRQGPVRVPSHGQANWEARTSDVRFQPGALTRLGAGVSRGIGSPATKAAADALATQTNEATGLPQGAIPPMMFGETLLDQARRWVPPGLIPGGGGGTR